MHKTSCGLIWKPTCIYLVFTEWKHVIDMHGLIYNISNVYKPKIYISAKFDKILFHCSKMGDIYHLVCPCPLAVRTRLLYLSRDFVYRPILAKGELSYQKKEENTTYQQCICINEGIAYRYEVTSNTLTEICYVTGVALCKV